MAGLVGVCAAAGRDEQPERWDRKARPPLVLLELSSPGQHTVLRLLVGVYLDERVCYREATPVVDPQLRFQRGRDVPLAPAAAVTWAEHVADSARARDEGRQLVLLGHAERTEARTASAAQALSLRRAAAARALLSARGVPAERLRITARGTDDSALLPEDETGEVAAARRRVTPQLTDGPSELGAWLIRRTGDQRPLLRWLLAATSPGPPGARSQINGGEPFEVGHHVPRLTLQVDAEAAARVGLQADARVLGPGGLSADRRGLLRLLGELARSDCRLPDPGPPAPEKGTPP